VGKIASCPPPVARAPAAPQKSLNGKLVFPFKDFFGTPVFRLRIFLGPPTYSQDTRPCGSCEPAWAEVTANTEVQTGRRPAVSGRWMTKSDDQPGPLHRRLWVPLAEWGALCQGRVKHGRSFSTLQHSSPGGCSSDGDLQLHCITH
jgi:hypothetical protein